MLSYGRCHGADHNIVFTVLVYRVSTYAPGMSMHSDSGMHVCLVADSVSSSTWLSCSSPAFRYRYAVSSLCSV